MLSNRAIYEKSQYSDDLNKIISHALNAVDPKTCVKNVLIKSFNQLHFEKKAIDLAEVKKIFVVGVGKAVLPMALAISELLPDQIYQGVLITKHLDPQIQAKINKNIQIETGSHPVPSEASLLATKKLVRMLVKTENEDLVIGLISGGGSALLTLPEEEIGLELLQNITSKLLKCGANIEEINTIRKHLDIVKGGGLLKYIFPARSIHLILSDVVDDPISMIASGPTSADPTTFEEALKIIQKYKIEKIVDKKIIDYLKMGIAGQRGESIKPDDPILDGHENIIVGSLTTAAEAARNRAEKLGFETKIISTSLMGEASEKGLLLAEKLVKTKKERKSGSKPTCLIAGGETTVTVKGDGNGGRNQELALSAAQVLDGIRDVALVSFATDGEDGPTDAAGGYVTGETIEKGERFNMNAEEFLNDNNAYEYLEKVGGLIRTGPTGTNVTDLVIMIAS